MAMNIIRDTRFNSDSYSYSSNNKDQFFREVAAMEENTEWENTKVKEIRILPRKDEIENPDLISHSGLLLNGIPLRNIAYPSLYDRAHVSGSALGKLSGENLSKVLNLCLQTADKDTIAQLVVCGNSVSAVHSDEYVRLPSEKVFQDIDSILKERFSSFKFRSGHIDHSLMVADYDIADKRISSQYGDMLEGLNVTTAITVATSNIGLSGVRISPQFLHDGTDFIIGKPLIVKHKGKNATMDKIRENANMTYSLINKSIVSFSKMQEIPIQYPVPCFCNVAKRIGIPKKLAMAALEDYKMEVENKLLSNALELYIALTEVLSYAKYEKMPDHEIDDLKETVGRALSINFSDYDIPEIEWHMKKDKGYVFHAA
jgi:hypothetical protein